MNWKRVRGLYQLDGLQLRMRVRGSKHIKLLTEDSLQRKRHRITSDGPMGASGQVMCSAGTCTFGAGIPQGVQSCRTRLRFTSHPSCQNNMQVLSSENFDRCIGPFLLLRTTEAVIVINFTRRRFRGRRPGRCAKGGRSFGGESAYMQLTIDPLWSRHLSGQRQDQRGAFNIASNSTSNTAVKLSTKFPVRW